MLCRAMLSIPYRRHAERYPVNCAAAAEHGSCGDLRVRLTNISSSGCQAISAPAPARGDRVTVRLPVVGWIDMFCVWTGNTHAGFQFERVIRQSDFIMMLEALRAEPARVYGRSIQDNHAV